MADYRHNVEAVANAPESNLRSAVQALCSQVPYAHMFLARHLEKADRDARIQALAPQARESPSNHHRLTDRPVNRLLFSRNDTTTTASKTRKKSPTFTTTHTTKTEPGLRIKKEREYKTDTCAQCGKVFRLHDMKTEKCRYHRGEQTVRIFYI